MLWILGFIALILVMINTQLHLLVEQAKRMADAYDNFVEASK